MDTNRATLHITWSDRGAGDQMSVTTVESNGMDELMCVRSLMMLLIVMMMFV